MDSVDCGLSLAKSGDSATSRSSNDTTLTSTGDKWYVQRRHTCSFCSYKNPVVFVDLEFFVLSKTLQYFYIITNKIREFEKRKNDKNDWVFIGNFFKKRKNSKTTKTFDDSFISKILLHLITRCYQNSLIWKYHNTAVCSFFRHRFQTNCWQNN